LSRPKLRTQLTLLYAGPFLFTGALLLTIPLLQTGHTAQVGTGAPPPPTPGTNFQRVLLASLFALALMAVVAFVVGWIVAGRFLHPLRAITATAREISASNLHRRLGPTGRATEFRALAATLDDLFARLEAAFESQRRFVANASHELRTPLTAERALLQVALADPDASAASLRAACQDVLALGEQQERLIEALLTLASGEQGVEHRERFDLGDVANAVVDARRREAKERGLRLVTALDPAPLEGDPKLVESLVANLVDNALRHNVAGGCVEIVTGGAGLRIANTGPVVPAAELARLFEPFRQLNRERTGEGHGLGLAIVRAIATAHDATLMPEARPEGGLTISVMF
jgi:signal transduction histidine kinase